MEQSPIGDESPYIQFDMIAIRQLELDYQNTIECIKELLPPVNWDSHLETRQYFLDEFNILLPNQRIETLKDLRAKYNDQEEEYELLSGLIELKRVQSIYRNYIQCIIRHSDSGGNIVLRYYNREWVLPNRQALPYTDAIRECIIKIVMTESRFDRPEKGE